MAECISISESSMVDIELIHLHPVDIKIFSYRKPFKY